MGRRARRGFDGWFAVSFAGLGLVVAAGCGGDPPPTHLGTDVLSGDTLNYAVVTVGADGTTTFGETFTGSVDLDPLGAGDVRTATGGGTATLIYRTRADGTRDWLQLLDGNSSSVMSTSWRAADGAIFIAGPASVTKLDPSGAPVWSSPCAGWGCSSAYSVTSAAATADGGIVLLGSDNGLVRLGGDGTVSWIRAAAELGTACPTLAIAKVLEAPDGTLLLGGDTPWSCTSSSSPWGLFIMRLDGGGNLRVNRTVKNLDDNSEAYLLDMAIGPDGSVFAAGDIQGTVDFGDGAAQVVRSAGSGAAGFAMKMRPDFSLLAANKTSANQNFPRLIAPAPDGGLFEVEHHSNEQKGIPTDPYLVRLDASLNGRSSLRLAGTTSFVTGLAVGGDVIAVVGFGPANEYLPGTSADALPSGLFLARYRF